jgi:hypothetical protein
MYRFDNLLRSSTFTGVVTIEIMRMWLHNLQKASIRFSLVSLGRQSQFNTFSSMCNDRVRRGSFIVLIVWMLPTLQDRCYHGFYQNLIRDALTITEHQGRLNLKQYILFERCVLGLLGRQSCLRKQLLLSVLVGLENTVESQSAKMISGMENCI